MNNYSKPWDNLSLKDKAEMMKVAVNNGMTSLSDIKEAYNKYAENNEYAEGGPLKQWTLVDETAYKRWRNNLPDNLRETNDNDYDMRAAFKAGMQPEWNDRDKSYHLGSRDPNTGRILKAPHHPTYLEATATDAGLGYYPIIDSNGNTYTKTWKGNEKIQNMINPEVEVPYRVGNEYADGGNLFFMGGPNRVASSSVPSKRRKRPVAEDKNYRKVVTLYQGYIDRGLSPETALELTNQNIRESGWDTWKSGDGRHNKSADALMDHVMEWHKRMYPDTLDVKSFDDFYNALENGAHRYNPRYKGYKDELIELRNGIKNRVNHYRAKQGQQPLAFIETSTLPVEDTTTPINVLMPTDTQDNYTASEDNVLPINMYETPGIQSNYINPAELAPLTQENISACGGNLYAKGGNTATSGNYSPSKRLRNDIATWEGSSMKTNRSFEAEAKDFNATIPKEIRDKLQPSQLDALYSYGYNVGMGNLKNRVLPVLELYSQGKASNEDVQKAMWASKDSQLRGLTKRRNWEREMFGGDYRSVYTGKPTSYQIPKAFFDNINAEIQIPQMQVPDNDIDPATVYKQPVIDPTLFQKPVVKVETPVYDPNEERRERLNSFNTVMGLMGAENPLGGYSGLLSGNSSGLMSAVQGIYGNTYSNGGYLSEEKKSTPNIIISNPNENEFGIGGLLTNASSGILSFVNTLTGNTSYQREKPKVYKSISGKHFKTLKEAANDNYNLKNGKGEYSSKDITYKVQKGDNLWNIAKQNNIGLDTLYEYNPQYKEGKTLMPNDNLVIGKQSGIKAYNIRDQWKKEKEINKSNIAAIQSVNHEGNYVIIDKANKKLVVYDKDNKPIYTTNDISTGASGDDYNTITYMGKSGEIENNAGNNSTPAGILKVSSVGEYHGFPSFQRARYNSSTGEYYQVHPWVFDKEKGKYVQDKTKLVRDEVASSMHYGNTSEKANSNGCVRVGGDTLKHLSKYIGEGTNIYTLPSKGGSRFISKDGKLSFIADNPYGSNTGKKQNWDDYNVQTDKSYSKLSIIPKTQGSHEFKRNENSYISSLEKNKKLIMNKFNMDSDTYNHLAELALGIAQQETKYNTSTKKEIKDSTPDFIMNIARGNSNRSRGITQIKLKGDNPGMQEVYKDLGITEKGLDNASTSALATIARLAYIYNTEVRGHNYKGANNKDVNAYDALLYKWMGSNNELIKNTATPDKNNYIRNVKRYANNYNMFSVRE